MSTRAIYTFGQQTEYYHVYKHWDGYPSGALAAIEASIPFAWPLPRFEPDDFAAAFVHANRDGQCGSIYRQIDAATHGLDRFDRAERPVTIQVHKRYPEGGGVRLMHSGEWRDVAPRDIAYRYEITARAGELIVAAYRVAHNGARWTQTLLATGTPQHVRDQCGEKD